MYNVSLLQLTSIDEEELCHGSQRNVQHMSTLAEVPHTVPGRSGVTGGAEVVRLR